VGKKTKNGHDSNGKLEQYQKYTVCEKNAEKLLGAERLTAVNQGIKPGRPRLQGQSLTGTDSSGKELPGNSSSWIQDLDDCRLDINTLHAIGAGRPVDLDLSQYAAAA
jgi:hypothetical protein